ncbi:MAG TPA: NADPH-dependent oxidoreductase [Candidatus Deferrimicrobium sp.]|nr:NADPH-dependent oxidoreductase [Candidatus Deferrimicrobium sp.]
MNQILEFLNSHASVRQFTDRPITEHEERIILTSAQRSPTSSNLQAYSIISVRDQESKRELARICGEQQHVARCPLFLVFCPDLYRLSLINKEKGYPFQGEYTDLFIVATVDATLAAGRALMAAQAMGMGGVMVGAIRDRIDEACTLLDLPPLTYPLMGMSLGYPAAKPTLKPRLPVEAVCFKESYTTESRERCISEYDETMSKLGYLKGRQFEPDKYPHFRGQYSWSEHSARTLASSSPEIISGHMMPFLQARGFLKK